MAATKLFVGKLSFDTTDQSLNDLFSTYGTVASATVIKDRDTNRSRGFGFVEMTDLKAAQKAIAELDGKEFEGMNIVVNAAKERDDKPRGNGGSRRSW